MAEEFLIWWAQLRFRGILHEVQLSQSGRRAIQACSGYSGSNLIPGRQPLRILAKWPPPGGVG
jgi:hypothetical protein